MEKIKFSHKIVVADGQARKQAGNAVPVKLGEFVANCINEYINDRKQNRNMMLGQLALAYHT